MKIYNRWWRHTILILVMIFLLLTIVVARGPEGIKGILWGFAPKKEFCTRFYNQFQTYCTAEKTQFSTIQSNFGMYDPSGAYKDDTRVAVNHVYISWVNYSSKDLSESIQKSSSKKRWLLLTVEPWPTNENNKTKDTLFTDIAAGKYDKEISALCTQINKEGKQIFIRWGHEMENVTERYPWAQHDSKGYINAYRYFTNECRKHTTLAYYVWSPVGDRGLESYYPGSDVVDYTGVSVYGFYEMDKEYHGQPRTFNEIFKEKYERVAKYNKPIMIAELGVNGTDKHKELWLREAFASFNSYDKLKTVVFFNSKDNPGAWESKFAIPDWRTNGIFEQATY